MINQDIVKVLKAIPMHLEKSGIEWFVTGKTNLALQEIDVSPGRMGILIKHKDLDCFLKLFSDFRHSNIEALENGEALEIVLFIDDVEVLVCAEYNHGIYWLVNNNPVSIKVADFKIPCLSLAAEKEAYEKMGREKDLIKIQKIKDVIEEHIKA